MDITFTIPTEHIEIVGLAYGIDADDYATNQEALDALKTALFNRLKKKVIQYKKRQVTVSADDEMTMS